MDKTNTNAVAPDPLDNLTRADFIRARDAATEKFGNPPTLMLVDRRTSLQFVHFEQTDDEKTNNYTEGASSFKIGGVYGICTIQGGRFLKFASPNDSDELFDVRAYLIENPASIPDAFLDNITRQDMIDAVQAAAAHFGGLLPTFMLLDSVTAMNFVRYHGLKTNEKNPEQSEKLSAISRIFGLLAAATPSKDRFFRLAHPAVAGELFDVREFFRTRHAAEVHAAAEQAKISQQLAQMADNESIRKAGERFNNHMTEAALQKLPGMKLAGNSTLHVETRRENLIVTYHAVFDTAEAVMGSRVVGEYAVQPQTPA